MSKRTKGRTAKKNRATEAVTDPAELTELYRAGNYRKCWDCGRGQQLPDSAGDAILAVVWSGFRLGCLEPAAGLLSRSREQVPSFRRAVASAVLAHGAGEFTECVEIAHAVLTNDQDLISGLTASGHQFEETREFVTAVANSLLQLRKPQAAEELLRRAISIRDNVAEFYIELYQIARREADQEKQRRILTDGMVRAAHKDDLAKFAANLLGEQRISVCMIVKNEEKLLPRALASIHELAYEIIVVDTGSTDLTVEIAESFGAKVFHHEWQNDFSLHRNQSLAYATGEWVMILDADEELVGQDVGRLRQALLIPNLNILSISVHNQHLRTGETTSFLPSVRLWRRKLNLHYEGIVHNELRLPPTEPILRVDVRLNHFGYGLDWEQMKTKIARSRALLEQQLADNPNHAFANFNLAQLLRGESQNPSADTCRRIIEHAGRTVKFTDPDNRDQRHLHLMALDQMTTAYFYLKDYENAESCAKRALAIDPGYLDPLFALGHIYAAQRNFDEAIPAYRNFITAANAYDPGKETTNFILQHSQDQASAHFALGLIYEEKQDWAAAESHFLQASKLREHHQDVDTHLAYIAYRRGEYDTAQKYAERQLRSTETDVPARWLLAKIARARGLSADALRQCEIILQHHADHNQAQQLKIELLRELGKESAAAAAIDQALRADPENPTVLNQQAEMLIASGRHEQALAVYSRLVKHNAQDAETHNNIGNCYYRLCDYAAAARAYELALSIRPQLVPALRNLGLTYCKLDDPAAAIAHLSRYLDYAKGDLEIEYLVARLLFDLNRYSEAIHFVERGLQKHPRSAELVAFLADCYNRLGHFDSARLGYRQALQLDPSMTQVRDILSQLETQLAQTSKIPVVKER